jgi:xanthine/CO dehydrogenase XdhC/CoxF family maturation factor
VPIGLDIGARSAPEIALAVMAEIPGRARRRHGPAAQHEAAA